MKRFGRVILVAYWVACYPAFLAHYLIPRITPPDLPSQVPTWWEHIIHSIISPITAPIVTYYGVKITMILGITIFPQGLYPLGAFLVTFIVVLIVLLRRHKRPNTGQGEK